MRNVKLASKRNNARVDDFPSLFKHGWKIVIHQLNYFKQFKNPLLQKALAVLILLLSAVSFA